MAQTAEAEKSVDRTRLNNLFQLMEKSLGRLARKTNSDDLHQVRYTSSKLLQILSGQEKLHKELVFKQEGNLDILVTSLQQVSDEQVHINVISIFNELLVRAHGGKRASIFVNHGVTNVLLFLMKQAACQELILSEEALLLIHSVLSKVGHKDRKFAVKARLHRALLLTLNLVKNNLSNVRFLQPLLQVLKLYTANSVNASYLGKHSAINLMFRVISVCGRKHVNSSKLALENLQNMTKSKSNSARLIGMGGVHLLLTHHTEWHQGDSKNRYISVRKAILYTLKNITNLKSGRQSFLDSDGMGVLYSTAKDVSECREMESLIMLSSLIMRKCCPRNRLPLDNVLSAVTFILPPSNVHVPECYTLSEFQSSAPTTDTPAGEESDHSSLDDDDDDDIDSDDERFRTDNQDEPDDFQGEGVDPPEVRTVEELRSYDKFFPEVFELDYFYSLEQDIQTDQWSQLTSSDISSRRESLISRKLSINSHPDSEEISMEVRAVSEQGFASAVNIKTGTSVFSLEFASSSSGSSSQSKTRASLQKSSSSSSRSRLKPKKLAQIKDKRARKIASVPTKTTEDMLDALRITSLGASRDALEDFDRSLTSSSEELDEDSGEITHDPQVYSQMAKETKSVYKFQKLAYPDLHGAKATPDSEPLYNRKFGVQRNKVFEDIDRMIHPENILDQVVYDLDAQIAQDSNQEPPELTNHDILRVGHQEPGSAGVLRFNAQFECGNLRKVIQVREFEYDLILNPDINTNHHHQWFYFEVSNMVSKHEYRFNIVNCEKLNSQFNFGMQPVMFSVTEALKGRATWARVGTDICYYRNHFLRSPQTTGGVKGRGYYTATFTIVFDYSYDVCYLAYHYPYTYTMLKTHLRQMEEQVDRSQVYFRNQNLCETLAGNIVPVLTITAQPRSKSREDIEELWSRPYIFLTGRVHPGESNSSWVMKGTIDFLMSSKPLAQQVRELYIFKIVPILNPDGVINGNHRSSLVAEDLNRRWLKPCPNLHPSIYHTKGLLHYLSMVNKTPLVYCDYHGHSRRKNIFMYGCSPLMSWLANDTQNAAYSIKGIDNGFKTLPRLLHMSSPLFCLQNCSFMVERCKESTARVVVWRQVGVVRSYTMESSYCGCDQGKYKDLHINTRMLEEMGRKFCEVMVKLAKTCSGFDQQLPDFGSSTGDLGMLEGLEDSIGGQDHNLKAGDAVAGSDSDDSSDDEDENDGEDEASL